MQAMHDLFTKSDYDLLPEGFPAQLIDGMLVRDPAPTYGHQNVQMRLLRLLMPLLDPDLLVASPVDVLVDDHNVFQPDIAVLAAAPAREAHYVGTPRIAFEILSPATARHDRDRKTPRLIEIGVEEVWLVDPRTRWVERHTSQGVRRVEGEDSISSDAVAGFELTPDLLFA